jgi:membrane protease YdiL (CAAX protease family)
MTKKNKINLNTFALIYFALFSISVLFNEEERCLKFPKLDDNFWPRMSVDMVIACALGLAIVLLTWLLSKHSRSFQELIKNFKTVLGPLSKTDIFFIAAFSALAEEFFFRGFMQAKLGIFFSSILFGMLHSGPGKKYIPWTIFALVMGFVLGGIYEWRENLLVPVVIHFIVNFVNLTFLQRYKVKKES